MPVVRFEVIPIELEQRRPTEALGNRRLLLEGRFRLLVGHLQEQKERQLLDVVAIREPVVTQDVALVPELLDEGLGIGHFFLFGVRAGGSFFNSFTTRSKSASTAVGCESSSA